MKCQPAISFCTGRTGVARVCMPHEAMMDTGVGSKVGGMDGCTFEACALTQSMHVGSGQPGPGVVGG